jgi:hypothetical protein
MAHRSRREVLNLTWPTFLGLVINLPAMISFAVRAGAEPDRTPGPGKLHWQAFLDQLGDLAAGTKNRGWDQEQYTGDLAALATSLNLQDPALLDALGQAEKSLEEWPAFTRLNPQPTFEIVLIRFEAGEVITHHDHPGMTGVLVCTSGHLRVTSYDLLEERPDEHSYLLRQVDDRILQSGQVSTLTARVRNIHRVVAQTPCEAIDIFTPPYDPVRTGKTRWYGVDPDPYRSLTGIYRARI